MLALAATPITRNVARNVEYRCPRVHRGERCGKLLVVGQLTEPVEVWCPRCKRTVVVGGS